MIYQMMRPINIGKDYFNKNMRYKFFIPTRFGNYDWGEYPCMEEFDNYYSDGNLLIKEIE